MTGTSSFEFEKTKGYGRLIDNKNLDDGISRKRVEVEVVGIAGVLSSALLNFENTNLLKINIEGLELELVKVISPRNLERIKMIQYETWLEGIVTLKPAQIP
jgi:hypothetical protein